MKKISLILVFVTAIFMLNTQSRYFTPYYLMDFYKMEISPLVSSSEHTFHQESHARLVSLVNYSTVIHWDTRNKHKQFEQFLDMFTYLENEAFYSSIVWSNSIPDVIYAVDDFCKVLSNFNKFGSIKKFVLLIHFNENWGVFSSYVPDRTTDWDSWEDGILNRGCNPEDIIDLIDNENTLAVFTVQHQAINHPKVHSIPIGIDNTMILKKMEETPVNKTKLLMINYSSERDSQFNLNEDKFDDIKLTNSYGLSLYDYYDEMLESKFILCPSGLGWDTYRLWESFLLRTIPVLERYNRTDGWHRTMDDLPVLWVESYEDLSQSLLESEYIKIANDSSRYKYEKLTKEFWKTFVESYLEQ